MPIKQVVVFDGLREFGVRPRALFDEYIELLARDIAAHLGDGSRLVPAACPGCGTPGGRPAFSKLSFTYVACDGCGSVFVSPRPTTASLREFVAASEALRFWRSRVERETLPERAHAIFHPRAHWIQRGAQDAGEASPVLVDLHSRYPAFLDAVARSGVFDRIVSVAPAVDLSDVTGVPRVMVEERLEGALELSPIGGLLSAQECLERAAEPDRLVAHAATLLRDGGLLFLTTVTWSGFDLQVLGGRSKNVLPPIHLNLLSLEGIRRLLSRHGFTVVELSTPGQLDTEIVAHAVAEDPEIPLPPFVDELIRRRGEPEHAAFQQFLQEALLSSHVRLVARKASADRAR